MLSVCKRIPEWARRGAPTSPLLGPLQTTAFRRRISPFSGQRWWRECGPISALSEVACSTDDNSHLSFPPAQDKPQYVRLSSICSRPWLTQGSPEREKDTNYMQVLRVKVFIFCPKLCLSCWGERKVFPFFIIFFLQDKSIIFAWDLILNLWTVMPQFNSLQFTFSKYFYGQPVFDFF